MHEINHNRLAESASFLFQGNAYDLLQQVEDNSIDLVLTDPPYKDYHSSHRVKSPARTPIKTNHYDLDLLIYHIHRVLKPHRHFYIFIDHQNVCAVTAAIKAFPGLRVKNILIWEKKNHGMGDLRGNYSPKYEMIVFGTKGKGRNLIGKRIPNVLRSESSLAAYHHPTPKPPDILRTLIEKSSHAGEWILDPFVGSGTVFDAVEGGRRLDRNVIGFEMNGVYVEDIRRRYSRASGG